MIVAVPASGICWGNSPDMGLHRASQLKSGLCVWHMDRGPGDKQGHCARNISGGNTPSGKGEVEANAKGPIALLLNPYAATSTEH